jgi:two-component system phosphate regulon sensor histidine kinase PhoR
MLYAALAAVVAVTMFAAYLLWRDLQREMRASELRAQFVASVSHELKTPLTAIRMFAETLQMGRCPNAEMQSEYLGTIVNECERLSRLVDGVLMFSKSEQGKKTYRLRPVQAADAVRAAARTLEYPLSQQGFRLHIAVEDELPELKADEDALEQAILNLLSNAIKYSGDARDIELGLYREGREVVVRVRDHGIGIAAQEQARIFDKFYRAPTPENQLVPGSGLGLALVAQIMKSHGGRATVESAPGEGSTFYLRLPAEAVAECKLEVKI